MWCLVCLSFGNCYCVQVLIASSLPSDSSLPNSSMVEAPLTINIPCGQSSRAPSEYSRLSGSMQGTNITIPVSVQKSEGFDANGSTSGSLPARKKRKPWSSDEDKELIAAVQKCGEGNWANILKGDFKGDRSASQLSQVVLLAYFLLGMLPSFCLYFYFFNISSTCNNVTLTQASFHVPQFSRCSRNEHIEWYKPFD